MNTKFLLIAMLGINIMLIIFASQICEVKMNQNIITQFYDLGSYSVFQTATLNQKTCTAGGVVVSLDNTPLNLNMSKNSFGDAINQTSTAQSGTYVGGVSVASFFIDVGRMILGIIVLLLGIPLPAFLASLGLPTIATLIISTIVIPLYLIGVVEFFGGRVL